MLDADRPPERRAREPRDVAGRENGRVGRAQRLVDEDAVLHLESGLRCEAVVRDDAEPGHDEVGRNPAAVGLERKPRAVRLEARETFPGRTSTPRCA